MSNVTPNDMNSFLEKITNTTDTNMKLIICSKLLTYLADSSNPIVCQEIGIFIIDTLVGWLQSSNFKLIQIGLDILTELVNRMRADFQPYLTTLVPPLVDKLGDSKDTIREKALNLFRKLVEQDVVTLQNLFDKIAVACFSHKNSNVREQIMHLLMLVLDEYGASSLCISKLVPHIVKLLSDPNAAVRATAFDTLCHIYKYVGERLRLDLQNNYSISIPPKKFTALMTRFHEIKADQSDISSMKSYNSISASRPPITPSSLGLSSMSTKSKLSSFRKPNGTNNQAGAIDEDSFLKSFENVPTVQIVSSRDLEDNLRMYHDIIENVDEDWSKRVDSLKKIRSLVVAGALKYEEFYFRLNLLIPPILASLKDLRSQVIREACITVAYLSKNLASKFNYFAETVLSSLINLIQNSAKVIASSALICIRFLLQYTHTSRLIPIIANNLNSKSKEIRKACCEFIYLILQTLHTKSMERHASTIQEAIKKGIADADADARAHSRNAYREFSNHFPDLGESLKNSLDYPYRKLLNSNSNSGSSTSLSRISDVSNISVRSNSAIDLQAVKWQSGLPFSCKTTNIKCHDKGMTIGCSKGLKRYRSACFVPPLRKPPTVTWSCNSGGHISARRDENINCTESEPSSGEPLRASRRKTSKAANEKIYRFVKQLRRPNSSDDDDEAAMGVETVVVNGRRRRTRNSAEFNYSNQLPLDNASLQELLNKVMHHEAAWPFLRPPVSRYEAADYFEIVKRPMDFATIKHKLNMLQYHTNSQVISDSMLVFSNCFLYNKETSDVYQAGVRLMTYLKKLCKEMNFTIEEGEQEERDDIDNSSVSDGEEYMPKKKIRLDK